MSDCRTQIDKAKSLIAGGVKGQTGIWADLGSSDNVYTSALLELLEPSSSIYAIDQVFSGEFYVGVVLDGSRSI